jgi:hypothetical protein
MTEDLIHEINSRFKKALAKDPNTLTCIVTGKSRPTNAAYLDEKAKNAGSKENFIAHYICRDALTLLKKGKTLDEVRAELSVELTVSKPSSSVLSEAIKINGR